MNCFEVHVKTFQNKTSIRKVPVPPVWILNDWQEESEVVRSIAEQLLDCEVVLDDDPPRRLTAVDIIVVCPYNAQAV